MLAATCQESRVSAFGLAALQLALCVPLFLPTPEKAVRARLRLVSANLLYRQRDARAFSAWLAKVDPDFLVLLELNDAWVSALEVDLIRYPHRIELPREDAYGIGLYSKASTLSSIDVPQGLPPMIAAHAHHAGAPVTLVAVHTAPPISERAASQRDQHLRWIASFASRERSGVIVAGDLNATSWSPAFRSSVGAWPLIDSRNGFGIEGSWPASWPALLRIPIDHVLMTPDIHTLERVVGPNTGSDHRPIYVELGL